MTRRCLIGTPVYGGCHPAYVESLDLTISVLAKAGWEVVPLVRSGSLLTLLRNEIAGEFLVKKGADVLLWIDADEGWRPSDAASVVEAASTFGVVGGVYRKKPAHLDQLPWKEIAEAAIRGVKPSELQFVGQEMTFDFLPGDVDAMQGYVGPRKTLHNRNFVRVAHAGTGFLAVTREALAKIVVSDLAPTVDGGMSIFFQTPIVDGKFNGEDWAFSNLVRAAGLEIWMDIDCRIDHYGSIGVSGNLSGEWLHDFARKTVRK